MTRSEVYNNVDNRNQQNSSFERAQHDGKVQSFIYDSQITGTLFKIHHNHIFNVGQHTLSNLDIQRNSTQGYSMPMNTSNQHILTDQK